MGSRPLFGSKVERPKDEVEQDNRAQSATAAITGLSAGNTHTLNNPDLEEEIRVRSVSIAQEEGFAEQVHYEITVYEEEDSTAGVARSYGAGIESRVMFDPAMYSGEGAGVDIDIINNSDETITVTTAVQYEEVPD